MFSFFRTVDRVVEVKRGQRVALLRDGRFSQLLEPGKHHIYKEESLTELITVDILAELKALPAGDPLPADLPGTQIIEVEAHERVAVLVNRLYTQLLAPGRYRYWQEQGSLGLIRSDLRAAPVAIPADDPLPSAVAEQYTTQAHAQPVLLFRDGRPQRTLPAGRYRAWAGSPWSLQPLVPVAKEVSNDPWSSQVEGATFFQVEQWERAVVFVGGSANHTLGPGRYLWWDAAGPLVLRRYDLREEPAPLADDDPLPASVAGQYNTALHADPVLLQNGGRPIKVLPPGRYRLWGGGAYSIIALPKALVPISNDPYAVASDDADIVSIGVHEAGMVFVKGVLQQGVGPGRYLWWKAAGALDLVRFDLRQEPAPLSADDPLPPAHAMYTVAAAFDAQALVLCRDGLPQKSLVEGRYRAWNGSRWSLKPVPLSLQSLDVAPQDLLSRDQVPVRVKAAVSVVVVDPVRTLGQPDWVNQIYTSVQLAMREVVTGRELDALLAERESLGTELRDRARALLPALGMSLEVVAIKDVILPGEVKDLLNRVTLARKEAEALAIKRREETAQTRQLANTARLLENNPVLLRLKELEALGEIAGRIDKITLVGSGDMVKSVMLSDLAKAREE